MNREMILRVADAIEAATAIEAEPRIGFNMNFVRQNIGGGADKTGHACGTVGCIAGWAISLREQFNDLTPIAGWNDGWAEQGAAVLGLSLRQARQLFLPDEEYWDFDEIEPRQAVAVLRHLAETGNVDWSVANEALA